MSRIVTIPSGRVILGTLVLAMGYIGAAEFRGFTPAPMPMDSAPIPDFMYAPPRADATLSFGKGQTASKPAAQAPSIGSPTAGGGGPVQEGRGVPGSFVHIKAGATAADKVPAKATGGFVSRHRARVPSRLFTIALGVSAVRGVPFHYLAGLTEDESGWRETAEGADGEQGLMQLKASTAIWCGGRVDRLDAFDNLDCGARYLYALYERFGSWELAFVAFKAGPETLPDRIPASAWAFARRALLKAEAYK